MDLYENVGYEKSFLNQVILRLDFLQFANTNDIFIDEIENGILRFFPRRGMDQIIRFNALNVVFDSNNPIPQSAHGGYQDGIQREYYSSSQNNKLILSNKSLIFEINEYSNYEEIQQWLKEIVVPLLLKNRLTVIRTGIRYINVFDSEKMRIRKNYFSREIAATISVNEFQEDNSVLLTRSMHVTEYQINGMQLVFRYGLYNPQYPNKLLNYSFALDYDCYTEEPIESVDELLRCIENGHGAIQMLFESSITDVLRKVMHNE